MRTYAATDTVRKNSKIIGKTVDGVTQNIVNLIGLKRDEIWIYQPEQDERIRAGDILVLSGDKKKLHEVIKQVRKD